MSTLFVLKKILPSIVLTASMLFVSGLFAQATPPSSYRAQVFEIKMAYRDALTNAYKEDSSSLKKKLYAILDRLKSIEPKPSILICDVASQLGELQIIKSELEQPSKKLRLERSELDLIRLKWLRASGDLSEASQLFRELSEAEFSRKDPDRLKSWIQNLFEKQLFEEGSFALERLKKESPKGDRALDFVIWSVHQTLQGMEPVGTKSYVDRSLEFYEFALTNYLNSSDARFQIMREFLEQYCALCKVSGKQRQGVEFIDSLVKKIGAMPANSDARVVLQDLTSEYAIRSRYLFGRKSEAATMAMQQLSKSLDSDAALQDIFQSFEIAAMTCPDSELPSLVQQFVARSFDNSMTVFRSGLSSASDSDELLSVEFESILRSWLSAHSSIFERLARKPDFVKMKQFIANFDSLPPSYFDQSGNENRFSDEFSGAYLGYKRFVVALSYGKLPVPKMAVLSDGEKRSKVELKDNVLLVVTGLHGKIPQRGPTLTPWERVRSINQHIDTYGLNGMMPNVVASEFLGSLMKEFYGRPFQLVTIVDDDFYSATREIHPDDIVPHMPRGLAEYMRSIEHPVAYEFQSKVWDAVTVEDRPRVFLFDRSGQLVRAYARFSDFQYGYESANQLIESLLNASTK